MTSTDTADVIQLPPPAPPHPAWCDRELCEVQWLTGGVGEWSGCHVAGPEIRVDIPGDEWGSVAVQLRQFFRESAPAVELTVLDEGDATIRIPADWVGAVVGAIAEASSAAWRGGPLLP
jgi:hypothetical protein